MIARITGLLLLNLITALALRAAPTGRIVGKVIDKVTREPMIAANVVVEGTSLGTSSDINGNFSIRLVPAGFQRVKASYIGYRSVVDSLVSVTEDQTTVVNFELEPVTLETAPVTITAQALGQSQAINQQLAAPQIMNVVSSARIQELPDANAAESAGRIPGVSILRSGGEANQIVVRGLQPKYNAVTINGVRMASSNANDRSADLSMISPFSLEGIEVIKVMTPDLDPDALGGTVNFQMREAKGEEEGMRYNLLAQGGYNGLSDAYNKFRNYRYVGSVEGRFFEDHRFGLFAQGDWERRNLTSNEYGATYTAASNNQTDYYTTRLNLNDVLRDRQRGNGTIVMDYKETDWKVALTNFFSSGVTESQNRGEVFDIAASPLHRFQFNYSKSTLNLLTNALEAEYSLPVVHLDAKLSHTYSETNNPYDWTVEFLAPDQNLNAFVGKSNLNPIVIPPVARNDTGAIFLNNITTPSNYARERAVTASLDLDASTNFPGLNTTATFKIGGKFRHQRRSNDHQESVGDGLGVTSARYIDSMIASHFPALAPYAGTTPLPFGPFVDPGFDYGEFLNGDYPMVMPTSYPMLSEMINFVRANAGLIEQNDAISWAYSRSASTTFNYSGYENQAGAYAMTTLNIGSAVTFIPGVRYQFLRTRYTAPQGMQDTRSLHGGPYKHYDTTVVIDRSYWLPDLILKYKPLPWFDVRLAYTTTLAYPDYNTIVPRIDIDIGGTITWNNSELSPTRSRNYDLYASFYDNSFGLFTIGGFWKKIDDLIYGISFIENGMAAQPYFPQRYAYSSPISGSYTVVTSVNLPSTIDNYGIELDWQTHFWYLPNPLNGMVLNVNYTHVFSSTDYPYVLYRSPAPRVPPVRIDTTFSAPLLYRPNRILNLSLGYDYLGFSVRLSMLYQADIFTGFAGSAAWLQLHTSTAAYRRWDLSVKQNLPWFGLQIYGDINNLNAAKDVSVIAAPTGVPNSQQSYGLTGDLGLRLRF